MFVCQTFEFYKQFQRMNVKDSRARFIWTLNVFPCLKQTSLTVHRVCRHLALMSDLVWSAKLELGDLAWDSNSKFRLKLPFHCTFPSGRLDISELRLQAPKDQLRSVTFDLLVALGDKFVQLLMRYLSEEHNDAQTDGQCLSLNYKIKNIAYL